MGPIVDQSSTPLGALNAQTVKAFSTAPVAVFQASGKQIEATLSCSINQLRKGDPSMKSLYFFACIISLTGSVRAASKCADIPLSMTFLAPTGAPASIWNDVPNTAYQNGVSGVGAFIHINSDCVSGTHDAILDLLTAKRTVWMQYPEAIPGSIILLGPASFAGGSAFETKAHIDFHNITGYTVLTPGTAATFYITVGSTFTGPDGKSYQLRFHPDMSTCPFGAVCAPDLEGSTNASGMNLPVETDWALVTYTPRDRSRPWSTTNADQWIVDGEVSTSGVYERSTLFYNGRNCCSTQTHYGQYSMPFKLSITALAPLP